MHDHHCGCTDSPKQVEKPWCQAAQHSPTWTRSIHSSFNNGCWDYRRRNVAAIATHFHQLRLHPHPQCQYIHYLTSDYFKYEGNTVLTGTLTCSDVLYEDHKTSHWFAKLGHSSPSLSLPVKANESDKRKFQPCMTLSYRTAYELHALREARTFLIKMTTITPQNHIPSLFNQS